MKNKFPKDIRWQQRFDNYQRALASLGEFMSKASLSKLETQGLIKAFEYTYELGWNVLRDYLLFQGKTDLVGSRDAIKNAFKSGLLADGEVWMDMLESRNRTSHVYHEEIAQEIAAKIKSIYYPSFCKLEKKFLGLVKSE